MASQLDFPTPKTFRDRQQNDLFEPKVRRTDPDTSHAAASSAKPAAATHRRMIRQVLVARGPMTGDALDEFFGWPNATANRRLPELRDHGLVTMLTTTAPTRSGREARLWEVV